MRWIAFGFVWLIAIGSTLFALLLIAALIALPFSSAYNTSLPAWIALSLVALCGVVILVTKPILVREALLVCGALSAYFLWTLICPPIVRMSLPKWSEQSYAWVHDSYLLGTTSVNREAIHERRQAVLGALVWLAYLAGVLLLWIALFAWRETASAGAWYTILVLAILGTLFLVSEIRRGVSFARTMTSLEEIDLNKGKLELICKLAKARLARSADPLLNDVDNWPVMMLMALPEATIVSRVEMYSIGVKNGMPEYEVFEAMEMMAESVGADQGRPAGDMPRPCDLLSYVKYRLEREHGPVSEIGEQHVAECVRAAKDYYRIRI